MRQLNVSIDDRLFNKWKTIAATKGTEIVPLVRSILQSLVPEKESVTITASSREHPKFTGKAEISFYRGSAYDFWFGTVFVNEKASEVQQWLVGLNEKWKLTRENGQWGYIQICNIAVKPAVENCDVVLDFAGVSKLQ